MSPRQIGRLVLAGIAVIVVVILVASAVRPVINYFRQQAADAKAGEEHAVDDSVGRSLEAEGTSTLAAADSADTRQIIIIRENAHALELETRADPSASDRLPDSVLDRIRRGDELLCASGVECRQGGPAAPPVGP